MRMRDTIKALLVRPVAFHPILAKLCDSAGAGLMLSQAIYWSERTHDAGGWFYKTQEEWQEEICLSRWEQETARKTLRRLGFWFEEKRGVPCKLYFRVDLEKLGQAIAQYVDLPHTSLRESSTRENHGQARGNAADSGVAKQQAIKETETTPETTAEEGCAATSAAPAIFLTIPQNDGKEFPITHTQLAEWHTLYPAVDVPQELRKMRGWAIANPRNRKTRGGILRFVNRWLATAQDEAPTQGARGEASIGTSLPEMDGDTTQKRAEFLKAHSNGSGDRGRFAWIEITGYLQSQINPHSFDTWLKPAKYLCLDHAGTLYVEVPTPEFTHIKTKYGDLLRAAVGKLQGVQAVEFVTWS